MKTLDKLQAIVERKAHDDQIFMMTERKIMSALIEIAKQAHRINMYFSLECPACTSDAGPCYCFDVQDAMTMLNVALAALDKAIEGA